MEASHMEKWDMLPSNYEGFKARAFHREWELGKQQLEWLEEGREKTELKNIEIVPGWERKKNQKNTVKEMKWSFEKIAKHHGGSVVESILTFQLSVDNGLL